MATIPLYDLAMCRRPQQVYALLKAAGVKLNPYRDGGPSQPLSDWYEYEGRPRSLLQEPWEIFEDHATMSLVIKQ